MTPYSVEIGLRYSDDSGWERRVRLDTHAERVEIELGGQDFSMNMSELDWLITALQSAKASVAPSTTTASKGKDCDS